MKKIVALLLAVVMVLALAACNTSNTPSTTAGSGSETNGETTPATTVGAKKKVALITNTLGASAFIDNGAAGFRETAEKYGFEYSIAECADDASYEENARALVNDGYDLILGLSWQAANAISAVATDYPDAAAYALVDSSTGLDNVMDVNFHEEDGAYLIGQLAALTVDGESHNYGAVHAQQTQSGFEKWRYPYMQGVLSIDPDAKFTFNFVGSYSDPDTAYKLALQQYELGCLFINAACAGGDQGVFKAAQEKHFYTSGQDEDLTTPDNPYVVSCQIKDTYNAVAYVLDTFASGNWTAEDVNLGINDNAIGAVYVTHETDTPRSDRLSDEDIALLKQTAEDLKAGKIDLSSPGPEEDYKYPSILG